MKEKDIQNHIWENRSKWKDFISKAEFPEEDKFEDEISVSNLSAEQLIYSNVISRLKELYSEILDLEIFGVEVSLSKEGESTIRADFLGQQPGGPGIAILELKRDKQTEREAFTELLAYSNHINTVFPTHSKDDTILVLIAPFKVRTVKDAFLQTLIFDRKRVFVLSIDFDDPDDVKTLKLTPFIPSFEDIVRLSEVAFDKKNFDVRVIVWEDTPDFWNNSDQPKGEQDPTDFQKAMMNAVSSMAAQLMEEKQIIGFTYSSQQWPEIGMPLPNALVIVGLNPYKVANKMFYLGEHPEAKLSEIPDLENSYEMPNLADFITGLKSEANKKIHEEENYLTWLNIAWESNLYKIGRDVVRLVNLNVYDEHVAMDRGIMDWETFETNLMENITRFNYNVIPTGLIRQLYWETTNIDYKYWRKNKEHPIHGDLFGWAIETLISHTFFADFLERMFGDPFGIRDFEE